MKLQLSDIVNCWEPLLKLSERELPIKNAFRLGKIVKILSEERQMIENSKIKLFQKYGNPDPINSEQVKVSDENMPKLLAEWNAFLNETTEIDIEPIDSAFFEEIAYVNLTGRDMSFLMPLIEEFNARKKRNFNKKD